MPRYIEITADEVKVGMRIRTRENYPEGDSVTYEGEVTDIDGHHREVAGFENHSAYIRDTGFITVDRLAWVLPDLPNAIGSVIVIDGRAAALRGEVDEPLGTWYYLDTGENVWAPDRNRAEILFDADTT